MMNLKSKKIVVLSAFYEPIIGGAEQMAKEILERLGTKYEMILITCRLDKKLPQTENRRNFKLIRVGIGLKKIDKYLYPFLAFLRLRKIKPDIVHAVMESYAAGALLLAKYLYPKAKRILTLQSGNLDAPRKQKNFLIKIFWKLIHRVPNKLTAISGFLAKRAERLGVKKENIKIIPNGIDLSRIPVISEKNPKRVVCVARLSREKGLDYLIKAWPEVLKKEPDAKLVLISEGDKKKEIEKLIKEFNISDSVELKGIL